MKAALLLTSLLLIFTVTFYNSNSSIPSAKAAGETPPSAAAAKAQTTLESRSGSTLTGKATFVERPGGVEVTVEIAGAKPGLHGIHLHANGDCSAPDAASAGGHFNPDSANHGAPNLDPHHAGDLGNIAAAPNGKGKLKIMIKGLTVAPGAHSVVGRALVVHADPDDLKTQPSGNSGGRFACGVITAVQ
jgi:Cu-Zn family superoxide dismutase